MKANNTNKDKIASAYNAGSKYEYNRLLQSPLHKVEFELMTELLTEFVQSDSRVIDIGAGPGRYAEFLLQKGCHVGLIDLSEKSLSDFTQRMVNTHSENTLFTKVACATNLQGVESETFDIALLMGPLYHLTEEDERIAAIDECKRIVKRGGLVIVMFISPYPRLMKLASLADDRLGESNYLDEVLETGITYTSVENQRIPQWRCWPTQAVKLMENSGFKTIRIRNLEGVAAFQGKENLEKINNPETKRPWYELLRRTCEIPDLLVATTHFTYIGKASQSSETV